MKLENYRDIQQQIFAFNYLIYFNYFKMIIYVIIPFWKNSLVL